MEYGIICTRQTYMRKNYFIKNSSVANLTLQASEEGGVVSLKVEVIEELSILKRSEKKLFKLFKQILQDFQNKQLEKES